MAQPIPGLDDELVDTVVAMHLAEVAYQMKDASRRCKEGAVNATKNGAPKSHIQNTENLAEAFSYMELMQRAHTLLGHWDDGPCQAPPIRVVAR